MNHLPRILPLLVLAAAPLSAQRWQDHPPTFEVQLLTDTSWHKASETHVGGCSTFTFDSDRDADGYIARRFVNARAVRYVDRAGVQQQVPEGDVATLRACGGGASAQPKPPAECGRAPDSALALVNSTIARRSTGGSPWAITLGVSPSDVKSMTDATACRRITDAIALSAPPDTLSLLSVIQVGPVAYAVVRGNLMGAGTAHGEMALYLLNPELEVVSNQHFGY